MSGDSRFTPGESVLLAPAVRRVVAGNASLMTGPGTNTYVLGNDELTVIDPGPADAAHARAITAAAAPGRIRWILVTHTHRDHSPLAGALARDTGAQIIGWPPPDDGRQDVDFHADRVPSDGEVLQLGDLTLDVIHTPGHASNCVCYLLREQRMLFSGDHVLEGVTPVILPPDGDMTAYMASLEKLKAYDFEQIAPGHGGLIARGRRMLDLLRAHRLRRESKALRCLARLAEQTGAAPTLAELVPLVYDDVPVERHAWAALTLEAHLIKLERDGRVSGAAGGYRPVDE